jgi:hypothetical protein
MSDSPPGQGRLEGAAYGQRIRAGFGLIRAGSGYRELSIIPIRSAPVIDNICNF